VNGTISLSGINKVNLSSSVPGTYTVITGNIPTSVLPANFTVTVAGQAVNSERQTPSITVNTGTSVVLDFFSSGNLNLQWTNGEATGIWNTQDQNFEGGYNNTVTKFENGDAVMFTSNGEGPVTVDGTLRVSDMTIASGDYIFTGGSILSTPTVIGSSLTPTEKLIISAGATAEFQNNLNFAGGINIDSGAFMTLSGNGSFNGSPVEVLGDLSFVGSSDRVITGALSGNGTITKESTGSLSLMGYQGAFTGSLSHNAGLVILDGTFGGSYSSSGASDTVSFRATSGSSIQGAASFSASNRTQVSGESFSVGGALSIENVDFTIDPSLFVTTPFITATGTVTIGGANNIDITNFGSGGQPITLLSYSGNTDWSAYFGAITAGGQPLNQRQSAELIFDTNAVLLDMEAYENLYMRWTASESGVWNTSAHNFSDTIGVGFDQFLSKDFVRFDGLGQGIVTVAQAVQVSGMDVSGGAYTFSGADISGVPESDGSVVSPTAKLTISNNAIAEFQNRAVFVNGMEITSGAKAILSGGGTFGGMSVNNSGTLEIDKAADFTLDSSLIGSGTLIKKGQGSLTLSGNQFMATGLLDHQGGELVLSVDWRGTYSQSSGTLLKPAANVKIVGNSSFSGTIDPSGTFTVEGQATFNSATLSLDVATNDKLAVGSASFSGSNTVTLASASLVTGSYGFLSSSSALQSDSLSRWALTPLNINRVGASIAMSADSLSLLVNTTVTNMRLSYEGTSTGAWDSGSRNWSGGETFVGGDQATFQGLGQGTVVVDELINAGKVTFNDGHYELVGSGTLTGRVSQGLPDSDGSLTLNSGSLKFSNTGGGYFEGDARVNGGEMILNSTLTTEKDFYLGQDATLSFAGAIVDYTPYVGFLKANNIEILGTLTAKLTELTGVGYNDPLVIKVGEAINNLSLSSDNTSGNLALYEYSFAKNGGELTMTITPKSQGSIGEEIIEVAKGSGGGGSMVGSIVKAIGDGVPITGTLETAVLDIINSKTESEAREKISNMSGGVLAQGMDVAKEVMVNNRSYLNGILGYEPMYTEYYPVAAGASPQDSWTVQAAATGRWGSGDRVLNNPGYDIKNYSALLALYHRYESIRLGGAISIGKTETDWENGAGADTDDISGTLFARYDYFDWFISLEGFLGRSSVSSVRYPGAGTIANSDYDIDWYGAALYVGRLFDVGTWRVTPRLGGAYTSVSFPGFIETGAGTLNLKTGSAKIKSFELESGILIAKEFDLTSGYITPRLNLGVAFETQDESTKFETWFAEQAGVPSFVSEAADMGRIRGLVALGTDYAISDFTNLSVDYKGSFKENERSHSATLGLNFSW
jgi:uncharacterized protein with beta-barrel porin domain